MSAQNESPRTNDYGYGADGRFIVYTKNALGHQSTLEVDGRFGHPTRVQDPNGIEKRVLYDQFGQRYNEITVSPDEDEDAQIVYEKLWCEGNASCPQNGRFLIRAVDNQGESPETIYYDRLGRVVRKQTFGFSPNEDESAPVVLLDTEYTEFGAIKRLSKPYFEGETPRWTTTQYDVLNRITQVIEPNQATTTKSYQGLTVQLVNANQQTSTLEYNHFGEVVKSTGSVPGAVMRYDYDAAGRLIKTTDPESNHIINTYDLQGRQLTGHDPDAGLWAEKSTPLNTPMAYWSELPTMIMAIR